MSRFGAMLGGKKTPEPTPAPVAEPVVEETVVEAPAAEEEVDELVSYESDVTIYDMSKRELEEYGRTIGIELDRRHSRTKLITELQDYLANS
jgi:hypothetical protein|tara:strand:- start:269 stop:544 length:276 start_codon:yes stop_codon:yes gene_type:complete